MIAFGGKTQCVSAWEEEVFGYTNHQIRNRLINGWSVERAITTPIGIYNKK